MPIVTHTVEQSTQANGGRSVVLRMFDQDGREYMISFFLPATVDLEAIVSARITAQDQQLAEAEFEQLVGAK